MFFYNSGASIIKEDHLSTENIILDPVAVTYYF